MSKYNAKKVRADGFLFDSKLEHERYQQLKLFVAAGEISDLEVHPVYELAPKVVRILADGTRDTCHAIRHELDFRYVEAQRVVVEDVKGIKTAVWNLKHNLFKRRYPDVEYRVVTREDM